MINDNMRRSVLAAGLMACASVLGPAAARAQEAAQGGAEVPAADSAAAQYKFNLAPAQSAPGAQAEVLLTPRETGGYAAELQASALPDPATLKEGASTYVVWLYDAAAKKKERLAELPAAAGTGQAAFDVLWPSFALVVTAEPSAAPPDWSGVAVLTGQPVVPENPGPDVDAALAGAAEPPAAGASGADAAAGAVASGASGEAAGGDTSAVAAPPGADPAQAPGAVDSGGVAAGDPGAAAGADPSAGVAADAGAGVSADASAGVSAEVGADASAGVEASSGEGASSEGQSAEVVAEESEEEEGDRAKRKRKFKNDALDRMRAAAEGDEEEPQDEEEEGPEETSARSQLDAMAAAARGPELSGDFELGGTGPGAAATGRVQVETDGTARLWARDLPDPGGLGSDLNVFVLWGVDPATGQSRNLGVLQGDGDGRWSATVPDLQPGAVLVVTAEPGPQSASRSGPAVLGGRWER